MILTFLPKWGLVNGWTPSTLWIYELPDRFQVARSMTDQAQGGSWAASLIDSASNSLFACPGGVTFELLPGKIQQNEYYASNGFL
jgi:hypothetical protein